MCEKGGGGGRGGYIRKGWRMMARGEGGETHDERGEKEKEIRRKEGMRQGKDIGGMTLR